MLVSTSEDRSVREIICMREGEREREVKYGGTIHPRKGKRALSRVAVAAGGVAAACPSAGRSVGQTQIL